MRLLEPDQDLPFVLIAVSARGCPWDPAAIGRVLTNWKHWGVQRHHRFLPAEAIASAVVHTVTAPPGTHFDLIQVNPEAPVAKDTVEDTLAAQGKDQ